MRDIPPSFPPQRTTDKEAYAATPPLNDHADIAVSPALLPPAGHSEGESLGLPATSVSQSHVERTVPSFLLCHRFLPREVTAKSP